MTTMMADSPSAASTTRAYLMRCGLLCEGVKYSETDVLEAMRADALCENCTVESTADFAQCARKGYRPVLERRDGRIVSLAAKCARRTSIEECQTYDELINRIPASLRYASVRTFVADETVSESVRRAHKKTCEAIEKRESLILAGDVGTGKTHLAAAIIVDALLSKHKAIFCSVPTLLNSMKSFDDGKYQKIINAVCRADVLALDDLGAENYSDWGREQLYIIVNERYAGNRQTVVTTNLANPDSLVDHLGKKGVSITSRLFGMGDWVEVHGEDFRMRGRRRKKP